MKKGLIILLLIVAVAGLGIWKLVGAFQKGGELGDAAIAHFHEQFNANSFAAMYNEGSKALQQTGPSEDFVNTLKLIRGKLGAYKGGGREGINLNNSNGDNTLTMTCKSVFENGNGTETFLFDNNGDKPVLSGYHVESPALLK